MPQVHDLQISPVAATATLTPEQKRFNTLIGQIERARAKLAAWRDNAALHAQAHARLVLPLIDELAAARRQRVFLLDRLHGEAGWTRTERATLSALIREDAGELLEAGRGDPELKALFDRHGDIDFDTVQQESRAALKDALESATGLDLGDIDAIESEDDMLRHLQQRLAAAIEADDAAQAAAATAAAAAATAAGSGRSRKKAGAASAARRRREDEARLAVQSVREVYRKLASALHPDRETDPAERDAKTALMQQVNQAYAANDLLALLELQLQIEQIDAAHLAGAGAQRLRHYNKVLAEQLAELKTGIEAAELDFRVRNGIDPGQRLDPDRLPALVDEEARSLRAALAAHRREQPALADRAATRRWLKQERRRLKEEQEAEELYHLLSGLT